MIIPAVVELRITQPEPFQIPCVTLAFSGRKSCAPPLIKVATVLKSNANIQDEDAAPRREDAVVEARFLGVEK